MSGESALKVGDVPAVFALKSPLALVLVGIVALEVPRVGEPLFATAAAQGRLVGVVVTLLLVGLHLTSAGRREVAAATDALHRAVLLHERGVSQVRRNLMRFLHVDRGALPSDGVLLCMSTLQMHTVLRASHRVQATLGVAGKTSL